MSQTHNGPERGSTYSTPRWVKVFGIVVIVLALLVGIVLVTGIGSEHGPGRGTPSGDAGDHTLPYQAERSNVGTFQRLNVPLEHGMRQP